MWKDLTSKRNRLKTSKWPKKIFFFEHSIILLQQPVGNYSEAKDKIFLRRMARTPFKAEN
jgi:hypothetical protein